MADRYLPALASFSLTADENAVIASAMKTLSPWDFKPTTKSERAALKAAKNKILEYHLQRQNWNCCYCRNNLAGGGHFMIDREHILPKSHPNFKPFSFAMWNIAGSCKRCNMQIKKAIDSFVVDKDDSSKFQSSDNYLFIHPHFDLWTEHLSRVMKQEDDLKIVSYRRKGSEKAEYTYNFFKLRDLEVDVFDRAQGLVVHSEYSKASDELREIALNFGQ